MPLIFIYSVAVSSAFVLGGSILVGPQTMLPKTAGAPTASSRSADPQPSRCCKSRPLACPRVRRRALLVAVLYAWELVAAPPSTCAKTSPSPPTTSEKGLGARAEPGRR